MGERRIGQERPQPAGTARVATLACGRHALAPRAHAPQSPVSHGLCRSAPWVIGGLEGLQTTFWRTAASSLCWINA